MPRTRSIIDYLMCACDGGRAMWRMCEMCNMSQAHYARSGCDQELSLPSVSLIVVPGPVQAHCDALNTFWVVTPGPGPDRSFPIL